MKIIYALCLSGIVMCAFPVNAQTTDNQGPRGNVAGAIIDPNGVGLAGAAVRVHRVPLLSPGESRSKIASAEAHHSAESSSESAGSYRLDGLPAGNYLLCVEKFSEPFLDPCKWSKAVSVSVGPGSRTVADVRLTKGVFLRIHVKDPLGLLPPNSAPMGPPPIIGGVKFGTGAFLAADYTPAPEGGDFVMAIPTGVRLQLWLFSRDVTLGDSQGHPVDTSIDNVSFIATPGSDMEFSVTVLSRVQ